MDRYDNFLSKFLPKYIKNDLIDEIIISDENGNDAKKISERFKDNSKIKLYVNEERKGAFLNKITVCKYAKNTWIALIDSDNYADIDYFTLAQDKINNNNYHKETIIAPYFSNGIKFNEDLVVNKDNITNLRGEGKLGKLLNTGNFIINKYLIENIKLTSEILNFKDYGYDVYHFYLILFQQYNNLNINTLKELEYIHSVHSCNYFVLESRNTNEFKKTQEILQLKFDNLFK
tara:strand:+ start:1007 stop:1702 length:696 start_codon:yes stop_codon:yes gene_type:complete